MMLTPKLEVLPKEQRILWNELKCIPKDFVLYGGTAVALRYGHRESVDFDFFSFNRKFKLDTLKNISIFSKYANTRYKISEFHHDYTVKIAPNLEEVKVSFINCPNLIPGYIKEPDICSSNGIQIASPIDLIACKVLALNRRCAVKDFVDLAELISHNVSLEDGFAIALQLARSSEAGEKQLNLSGLKEDLKSKTLEKLLENLEEINFKKEPVNYIDILKKSGQQLNIDRVYKRKFTVKKELPCQCLKR